jgi:hypothetical protein
MKQRRDIRQVLILVFPRMHGPDQANNPIEQSKIKKVKRAINEVEGALLGVSNPDPNEPTDIFSTDLDHQTRKSEEQRTFPGGATPPTPDLTIREGNEDQQPRRQTEEQPKYDRY